MSASTTSPQTTAEDASVRPFEITVPQGDLVELRRRIAGVRLPSRELVDDRSQGVQLKTIQELIRYWTTEYDWRKCEARLNALPQFKTDIEGRTCITHRRQHLPRHLQRVPLHVGTVRRRATLGEDL